MRNYSFFSRQGVVFTRQSSEVPWTFWHTKDQFTVIGCALCSQFVANEENRKRLLLHILDGNLSPDIVETRCDRF
jgi:hypothetical protein